MIESNKENRVTGGVPLNEETGGTALDAAEESALWEKVQSGDDDSRERIILAYRPMVFWLAKKFRAPYGAFQDLLQEGMVGLIAAVDNFEPERSNRFTTYAYYKVKGRMANFLQRGEARAPWPVEDEFLERPDAFEADLDKMEWRISLGEGLERLPAREKDIVRSLVMEDRDAAEVASDHGVGISHVYRLRRRAVARLKSLFS
jgi:RNA polymerase sporulation-specific sigma factor